MIRRIFGELPEWAKAQHPLLRYELKRNQLEQDLRARLLRIMGWVFVLSILLLGGYVYATDWLSTDPGINQTQGLWRILFFPILIVQVILRVAGLSLGIGAISDERNRQTWDNLRVTEQGAMLALHTRWVAVFYRLRGLIYTIIAARIAVILALLWELTSMRGGFLNILSGNSVPSVPLSLGVILLAATMTAALLLPVTGTGIDIAVGLWISATIKNRAVAAIWQILYIVFRVASIALLLLGATRLLEGDLELEPLVSWLLMGAFSAFGDWGLSLMQLSQIVQEVWSSIPYSIFYGLLLLAIALIQVAVANGILLLAVRSAERNG